MNRYAILYGGPSDGSRIAVDQFRSEVHVSVMEPLGVGLRGDEPFDFVREARLPVKTGVYLAVGGPVRLREWAGWRAPGSGWDAPDHEICLYIYTGCRP